jgi:alpha-D-ribose 1-methylphosphonate 5-triphosphate synthase subunit PhnG
MAQPADKEAATAARQAVMRVVAKASREELADGLQKLGGAPGVARVRGPETGLVMLRGRIGGAGAPFNLGEATVTRATMRIATGETGHAYILGRDAEKARLAAIIDATWQRPGAREAVEDEIVAPIRQRLEADERSRREKIAATRVDFFTMVRGED